ncbi:hypothetical protein OG401_14440 [Kitasatospora purpeofusca]|uniref:hypothetical protein n=1 Tax=Kitasatospora purpeofusca TaxID=67352 RepID=UPI002250CC6E|nr:hypothetical protein [Kitasatospora purpeofusca]MCX4685498.1 hypothetical protein [Kitasatospora purpeofusca]
MSGIKRYSQDADAVEIRAVEVARIQDPRVCLVELSELFRECGRLAAEYADPVRVARMLVEDVAETWQAERWNIRHRAELVAA